MFLGIGTELVEGGVVPGLLQVVPVGGDFMLESEGTFLALGLVGTMVVLLSRVEGDGMVTGCVDETFCPVSKVTAR